MRPQIGDQASTTHRQLAVLLSRGRSLFIAAAVAEKVGSLRTAREFLRERAGSSKPGDMLRYLRRAPKVPPAADELR